MASLSASVCVVQETGLLNKGSLLSCSSLTHRTCKHDAASLPGPAKSSQTEAGLTEISRHLTGAVGSGVPVWAEEGIWVGGGGPSCPPGVNPACQVPPSNYHACPPDSPYQSSPSRLCFLPLSMSAWPVLCTLTSALIHQGYITWEPPELRAIPFYNFLHSIRGQGVSYAPM